ncbi:MAG TPA: TonB-dependent receptor [Humisphaera sp.]
MVSFPLARRALAAAVLASVPSLAIAENATTRPAELPTGPASVSPAFVTEAPPVVVTANRLDTPPAQVGSAYTVITGDEIGRRQQPLVADVLRTVPGLDVARSGGNNQITSVFLRGGESSHTLVLIDGVEANDPSSPNRAFDFSTLTTDNVERIEVLRGPQSTLWGSNAMGGVVNIITKKGDGRPRFTAYAEAGSYNTYREGLGYAGATGPVNYSLSLSQQNTQGFSAAAERFGATEGDGSDVTTGSARVGWDVSETFDVSLVARYQYAHVEIDDFGGPGGDNKDHRLVNHAAFLRLQPRFLLADGKFVNTVGLNYTYYDRDDNGTFGDHYDGGIYRLDYQGDLKLAAWNTLTFGVQADEENFASRTVSRRYADSVGLFLQDSANWSDKLFLTAGVRWEDHSASESAWTYRLTGAYYVLPATKLHASYGTGFKSPSLSNLYSSFGSPDLKPEKVDGWDVGVTQGFWNDRLSVDATFFRNDFDNLIDYDFVANKLQNVGAATTQGVELSLTARPTDAVSLFASYTYTDARNLDSDQTLLRRAPHKVSAGGTWRYSPKGDVTVTLVYNGGRADIDPVTFGRTSNGPYTLLNIATQYRLTDHVTVYARVENALDQDYEEVAGFGTAAVSAFGGVRFSF